MKIPVVSCNLTSPELQPCKKTVISNLKQLLLQTKELPEGYAYQFEGTDNMIDLIADFIKTERRCCTFFHFDMSVSNDHCLWLSITGPEGVKDFIIAELEL